MATASGSRIASATQAGALVYLWDFASSVASGSMLDELIAATRLTNFEWIRSTVVPQEAASLLRLGDVCSGSVTY
jgi:hypothetical protein